MLTNPDAVAEVFQLPIDVHLGETFLRHDLEVEGDLEAAFAFLDHAEVLFSAMDWIRIAADAAKLEDEARAAATRRNGRGRRRRSRCWALSAGASCYDVHMCARKTADGTASPRGIRLSAALERAIQHEADARDRSWSAMTGELLDEAIRLRRAPGVAFVDGATGRRAVVAGTALDVWEVVATWRSVEEDWDVLTQSYPWLSEMQLRSALGYYRLYPDEIDARIEREEAWTRERVREELPYAIPADPTR